MAFLHAEGFEDSQISDLLARYSGVSSIATGAGRNGGKALQVGSSSYMEIYATIPATTEVFATVALSRDSKIGHFLKFGNEDGNSSHVKISVNSSGAIEVKNNTNLIGSSAAGIVPATGYTSFQVRVVISNTTGVVQVRVNGGTENVIDLANVDTLFSTPAYITRVSLGDFNSGGPFGAGVYYDDFAVWDTTGTVNNGWLGDLRIDTILPNGDGDTITMTPSSTEVSGLGPYLGSATVNNVTGGEWDRGVSTQSARFLIPDNTTNQTNFAVGNTVKFADGQEREITVVTASGQLFVSVEGAVLDPALVGYPNIVEAYAPAVPTHYTLVDELPPSSTDYVYSNTVGAKDLFQMTNIPHTPTQVFGVVVTAQMRKDTIGTREGALVLRSNAVEADGPSVAPGTTGARYQHIFDTRPDGGTWTTADIAAVQAGVKVTV